MWINPLIDTILAIGFVCSIGWVILRFWPYFFSIIFIVAVIYEGWNLFQ